jgi:NAD(P)-dependent dehydrogenase (short-subunit alcohol dehydrogenase family)
MNQETLDATPVWLITGCSTGFGRALAERVVARGWRLVATARDASRLTDLVRGAEQQVLALDLDVTRPTQIQAAVDAAHERFGKIDVLVNNAGYGYQSTAEEGVEEEIRAQFDANVFGLFAVTRAVLPGMRKRRTGFIMNITSIAGLMGFPGSGYYGASKHAVEGFSDALKIEVAPLGIRVTCVEPGPFRTDWAGRSLHQTRTVIPEYEELVGQRQDAMRRSSGQQRGDPMRAGELMIALSEMPDPPRHMPLGEWGCDLLLTDRRQRLQQLEQVRDLGIATDFPDAT